MVQLPQPGDAFGRYRIVDRIGRGGMGVVFSARQIDLDREVALKLLSPDLADSEDYRHRFIREASALARLDSPHVITVHDAGEQDGWLYIATQLIPDGDLAERLARTGPLMPLLALDLLAQAAQGLADAHDVGIIHRDLKPSNILLRNRADGGVSAYICDLGIARTENSEHTRTAGVIGTLGYMAPERHNGHPATVASDIYAMGCLLWATLNGQAPYVGTDFAVALAHVQDPVPQLPPHLPGSQVINPLLHRTMSKDPAHRFQSARELRGALDAAARSLAGTSAATRLMTDPGAFRPHPGVPTPTPTPTQFPPLTRPPRQRAQGRSRAPWIVLAVLLVLAAAGGGGYAWWQKAQDDKLAPLASAVRELSGDKLSYSLGDSSATCAARKVVDASGRDDAGALAAEIGDSWQKLPQEEAVLVANAVINCSDQVYDRLVADLLADAGATDADCARGRLTETEVAYLLVAELEGNGGAVQGKLDELLTGCG